MTIAEARERCKSFIAKIPKDALILAILMLASSLSFGLGYLAGLDAIDLEIEKETATPEAGTGVVASKSGTKYYFPQCAGAERIAETNKVWFVSAPLAESAGYTLAANCKAD